MKLIVFTLRMEVASVELMDIEQQAKQVVVPKKEIGGRMKIPCKNCNQVEIWDLSRFTQLCIRSFPLLLNSTRTP